MSAVLYWLFARSIDLDAEAAMARREADELEREALQHQRPEAVRAEGGA